MNAIRCQVIAQEISDKLDAIKLELARDYQSGKYLNSKLSNIIWDANVLKCEFDLLEAEQKIEKRCGK